MELYSLNINGQRCLTISAEVPNWWPVRPRLNRRWLRCVVAGTLANCLVRN